MTDIPTLKSLQKRALDNFDRVARFLLVGLKLGHVMYGMACGSLIGTGVPWELTAVMFVSGLSGMIATEIYERNAK